MTKKISKMSREVDDGQRSDGSKREGRAERSEQHAEVLAKALDKFFTDARGRPSIGNLGTLRIAVEPTLQAWGYGKKD